jgi:hypothetical protein
MKIVGKRLRSETVRLQSRGMFSIQRNGWSKGCYNPTTQILMSLSLRTADLLRTGKFTKEETEIVKHAVEEFCTVRNVSVARLCSECDHKAELKGAWTEIAKALPYRSVQSVYRHGLRQLHPFKRGAWTEDECEFLIDLVTRMGKKWSLIGAKINRSADSCRDKYREMDESFIRGRWNDEETEKLKQVIREHLRADPTSDMKNLGKMVEEEGLKIAWSVVSKRMGKRSRLSCFKKWQKMTGIYSTSDQELSSSEPIHQHEMGHDNTVIRTQEEELLPSPQAAVTTVSGASGSNNAGADDDMILLAEVAGSNGNRSSDVDWDNIPVEKARLRWQELVEEFQSNATDDSILAMPLSEIAQHILNQKTSAQRAAETVEAVDLPAPESLHQRDV